MRDFSSVFGRVARQFSQEKAKRRQKRTKKKLNAFLSENCGKISIYGYCYFNDNVFKSKWVLVLDAYHDQTGADPEVGHGGAELWSIFSHKNY